MIPKIEFRYSWIYNEKFRNSKLTQEYLKEKNQKYPSKKKIINYIKKVEKMWKKEGNRILNEISRVSGLKWKEKKIICYVVGSGRCFSDPLTMKMFEKVEDFRDTLIHELIHQIQIQNNLKEWAKYIYKQNKNEHITTKNHLLLDAFLSKIIEKLYNKKGLNRIIKRDSKQLEYKRAWEIVEEESPDVILNKFYKLTK